MTLSEGQTADVGTPDLAGSGLSAAEPIFSDLIDRWLNEGDRLNELAGTPDPAAPGDTPTQLDGWKLRARELAGAALGRYRLPTLIGIGLVPLALLLVVANRSEQQVPRPPLHAAQTAAPAAPRSPHTVLAEPPVTVMAPRPLASRPPVGPDPVLALRAKPVTVTPKPVTVAKRSPAHPPRVVAPRTSPAARAAPTRTAKAVTPPPAPTGRPIITAGPKIQPAPRPAPGTKIASKTTFVPDSRIAPNLKLGSPSGRR